MGVVAWTVPAQEEGTVQAKVAAAPPGKEVSLPASEVKDTFFAYVLGIIRIGAEIDLDNEQMRSILVEFKSSLNLPFDLISRVTQHEDPQSAKRTIALEFKRDVSIPIPFSILFYHPGRIVSSRLLAFDVRRSVRADPGSSAPPEEALDLDLTEGSILVEIDGWLKALFGTRLQDTWIRHIVFFRWHGEWIGMLAGTTRPTGRVIRTYFDFTKNKIVFPVPDQLERAGRVFVPGRS
jgi:hypothetical protein